MYPESMIGTTSGCPPFKSTNNQGFNFVSGRSRNFLFENIKQNVFLTRVGCKYEFWKNWVKYHAQIVTDSFDKATRNLFIYMLVMFQNASIQNLF